MPTRSPSPPRTEATRLVAALTLAAACASASAGGLQVQPVRLDMSPDRPVGTLTVINPSSEPMLVQAEAFAWSQPGGQARGEPDRLDPDPGVLLSPPIFELPPGGRQLVRVGFRSAPALAAGREGTWRVWLSQLPADKPVGATPGGVRMLFRVSLPLFVTPPDTGRALPQWRRDAGGLTLTNAGARHLQFGSLALRCGVDAADVGLTYVLPGATVRWALPAGCAGRTLTIEADGDVGTIRQQLDPAPR